MTSEIEHWPPAPKEDVAEPAKAKRLIRFSPAIQILAGLGAGPLVFALFATVSFRFFEESIVPYEFNHLHEHPYWRVPIMMCVGIVIALRQRRFGIAFLISGTLAAIAHAVYTHVFMAWGTCMAC